MAIRDIKAGGPFLGVLGWLAFGAAGFGSWGVFEWGGGIIFGGVLLNDIIAGGGGIGIVGFITIN